LVLEYIGKTHILILSPFTPFIRIHPFTPSFFNPTQHSENAMAVAEYLQTHPAVEAVYVEETRQSASLVLS
jgi:O-acetylhomoserine/O-acetylserine sulfhydrylase-like pyridoxal-dependent enzyme